MNRPVVVTGMGVVSCFGTDIDPFYQSLLAGKSGVKLIDTFDCADFPTRIAAPVIDLDTSSYINKKLARRTDPFISYAMVAGKKALEDASLKQDQLTSLDKTKAGVLIGSGMGGMHSFTQNVQQFLEKGYRRVSPFFIPFTIVNMAGALLAIDLGFMGPNYSISTACATANYCITSAAKHIQSGEADIMLCGGTEAAIHSVGLSGFIACKALSQANDFPQKASKPWDKNRDGFVMGEGAGVLVLESLEHALERKARIYARYLGGAVSCDAYHMTEPAGDGKGVALCIKKALKDAALPLEEIDYINAHATSTPAGDMLEIAAIQNVFGNYSEKIKINATKSMIGHCLGAAGGLEAVACVKALESSFLHPTINLHNPEDSLKKMSIVTEAHKSPIQTAMSNSFGFGGHNSVVIFGKYES